MLDDWSSQLVEEQEGWKSPKQNEKKGMRSWQATFEAIKSKKEQKKLEKIFEKKLTMRKFYSK